MEVITHAVAKPSLDWLAEHFIEPQRGKLDERFLRFKTSPSHRSLPFYPLGGKPFSACLFIPSSDYYGNVGGGGGGGGASDLSYRAMPWVEQTHVSFLSHNLVLSLNAPTLPTKPLRASSALVGKGYAAAG